MRPPVTTFCFFLLVGTALWAAVPVRAASIPTSISGLVGWWDGNDPAGDGTPPANGSRLRQWHDKSGKGKHATGAVGKQAQTISNAIDGNGGIDFGADDDVRNTDPTSDFNTTDVPITTVIKGATDATYICITLAISAANEWFIFDERVFHHSSSGQFTALSQQENSSACYEQFGPFGTGINGNCNIIDGERSTDSISTTGSPVDYIAVNRAVCIGWRGLQQAAVNFGGIIAEIIVYDRQLTASKQNEVGFYFKQKFGINTTYVPLPITVYDGSCERGKLAVMRKIQRPWSSCSERPSDDSATYRVQCDPDHHRDTRRHGWGRVPIGATRVRECDW